MTPNPVKCHYCQNLCRKVARRKFDQGGDNYWQCDYHGGSTVKLWFPRPDDEKWYQVILTTQYKENYYDAVFVYDNPNVTKVFYISKAPTKYGPQEAVLALDYHPQNITPENLLQKLPTLLMFS